MSSDTIPSNEARQKLNESTGTFLGTGFIPTFFEKLSLIEAQKLFEG
jgi:hypothetical protein